MEKPLKNKTSLILSKESIKSFYFTKKYSFDMNNRTDISKYSNFFQKNQWFLYEKV